MCVFSVQLFCETFLILRIKRGFTRNVVGLHVKYPLFLPHFNENMFSGSRVPFGHMTKLMVAYHSFARALGHLTLTGFGFVV